MMYEKLRQRGEAIMEKLLNDGKQLGVQFGCPTEAEYIALFDKLTEREQYMLASLPVIVCDLNFNVPDSIIGDMDLTAAKKIAH